MSSLESLSYMFADHKSTSLYCSQPFGRQLSRSMQSLTTPGETMLWRGRLAECFPHGHLHLSCGPRPEVVGSGLHDCFRGALSTCRRGISFAMIAVYGD